MNKALGPSLRALGMTITLFQSIENIGRDTDLTALLVSYLPGTSPDFPTHSVGARDTSFWQGYTLPQNCSKSHPTCHIVPGSEGASIRRKVGLHIPCSPDYAVVTQDPSDSKHKGLHLTHSTHQHGSPAARLSSLCPLHARIQADGQPLVDTCHSGRGKG